MVKLTKKKVKEAIKDSLGNKSTIAKRCGVSHTAINYFLERNPELKEELTNEINRLVGLCENRLIEIALRGNPKDSTTLNANIKILHALKGDVWNEKRLIESKNLNVNVDLTKDQLNERLMNIVPSLDNGTGQ